MMRIAVIGSGAREHILTYALYHAPEPTTLFAFGTTANPGIMQLCSDYRIGDITDAAAVCSQLTAWEIDLTVIGPEAPLSTGTADACVLRGSLYSARTGHWPVSRPASPIPESCLKRQYRRQVPITGSSAVSARRRGHWHTSVSST